MTFTHALATNNYGPAKFIVATSAANGTHTTLSSALTAASSGDTIFLRDSVTEDVTLKAGVSISTFTGSSETPTVSITGKLSFASAGTVTISNIRLTTNSDFFLAVTGSAASIVNLRNCYMNCLNNTGISFTTASASSIINIFNCFGNIATTGISLFANSATGNMNIYYTNVFNSGGSTTASTASAGFVTIFNSAFNIAFTSSSTGSLGFFFCDVDNASFNITCLTVGGSGTHNAYHSQFNSGSASAISVSAGAALSLSLSHAASSNTNAITGVGSIVYSGITFPSSSSTINTTTQTGSGTLQGSKNTAPSAGFLGEQIRAVLANGTPTALTSTTSKNVTSISLTAGIWDVSGIIGFATGAGTVVTQMVAAISSTSATIPGNYGDDSIVLSITAGLTNFQNTLPIPALRVSLSSTTTYYLVANAIFTVSTYSAYGRISATRVG